MCVALVFGMSSANACECEGVELELLDYRSYDASDLVVVGEVIPIGDDYQIKISDVLKGKYKVKLINGTITDEEGIIDPCLGIPTEKGKYLFYLNEVKKGDKVFYSYSICSGTRPLNMKQYPAGLSTDKSKSELVKATEKWIKSLK